MGTACVKQSKVDPEKGEKKGEKKKKKPKSDADKTMTAKTAAQEILSGLMLLHATIRLLDLNITTPAGKVILALTVLSMLIQLTVIGVLLATSFLNYDKNKKEKNCVQILTGISTTLIIVLGLFETIISGLQAYVSGKN